MRHTAASAVLVSGWYRLSYRTTEGLFQLETHIRQLHRAVGIAVVDGKHLVFGTGSTQLMNGLVYALSPDADDASSPPASVVTMYTFCADVHTKERIGETKEFSSFFCSVRLCATIQKGDRDVRWSEVQMGDRDVRWPEVQMGRNHCSLGQRDDAELHQEFMELVTSPSNPDALLPQLGCNLAADPEIQPWTFKL
jgi:hypothetical protein